MFIVCVFISKYPSKEIYTLCKYIYIYIYECYWNSNKYVMICYAYKLHIHILYGYFELFWCKTKNACIYSYQKYAYYANIQYACVCMYIYIHVLNMYTNMEKRKTWIQILFRRFNHHVPSHHPSSSSASRFFRMPCGAGAGAAGVPSERLALRNARRRVQTIYGFNLCFLRALIIRTGGFAIRFRIASE